MSFVDSVQARLPKPIQAAMKKHHEMLKFGAVGGICFVITLAVNYTLKFTILADKPITALIFATVIATIASYILNREWAFRTRGGRERHYEAALFFLISGIGVGLNALPEYISRYWFMLEVPHISFVGQEVADFISGIILGTLVAMVFRWWAFKKWVFPHENARAIRRLHAVPDATGESTDTKAA